jgi:hypothetical protein
MNSRWVKSESILNNNSGDNDQVSSPSPKSGGPLKPRLDAVQKKIQAQIARLEEPTVLSSQRTRTPSANWWRR